MFQQIGISATRCNKMSDITVQKWKLFRDKPGLLDNIDKVVKKEVDSGSIPKDAKIVGLGTVDSNGIQVVVVAELLENTEKRSLKIKGIFEHDWDGDDSAAVKLVFASK
jgi:hypothetical protein